MSQTEIQNWVALYLATGICCLIASILTAVVVLGELYREKAWQDVRSRRTALLFVPRLWWRWQKRYLLSTPMTLTIVGAFALTMDWAS